MFTSKERNDLPENLKLRINDTEMRPQSLENTQNRKQRVHKRDLQSFCIIILKAAGRETYKTINNHNPIFMTEDFKLSLTNPYESSIF